MTLRELPAVDRLAEHPELQAFPRPIAVRAARESLAAARTRLRSGNSLTETELVRTAIQNARHLDTPAYAPAINATGIVLHTNLGRATLAPEAVAAARSVAESHAILEIDLQSGWRGSRQAGVSQLLCELTGAEAALVVNNNAGATILAVAGLAAGHDVLLSRGEMVEIGGHFRMPDVIVSAGARLVDVGTTNRTRISDYESAITEQTALLLKCHPSNYRIVGFTEETGLDEMVALGRDRGIAVGDDLGSGALVDLARIGLNDPPTVAARVATGVDLVWFSGDKLLGGPQCGIVVGNAAAMQRLAKHPLMRALRPDKITLAALEATLRLYRDTDPWQTIPVLRRLALTDQSLRRRADRLARKMARAGVPDVAAVRMRSEIGGGAAPGTTLASWGIQLAGMPAHDLSRALRHATPPVIGRVENNRVLLDLRTVDPVEETLVFRAVVDAAVPPHSD